MQRRFTISFILFLTAPSFLFADNDADIKTVNKRVEQIEKSKADLSALELNVQTGEFEGVPPRIKYYYNPKNAQLVIAHVNVGHEVFATNFTYYFHNNKIIKFVKSYTSHPENPPKQAIIYAEDGKVLWKNIDEPSVMTQTVADLYKRNMQLLRAFKEY